MGQYEHIATSSTQELQHSALSKETHDHAGPPISGSDCCRRRIRTCGPRTFCVYFLSLSFTILDRSSVDRSSQYLKHGNGLRRLWHKGLNDNSADGNKEIKGAPFHAPSYPSTHLFGSPGTSGGKLSD